MKIKFGIGSLSLSLFAQQCGGKTIGGDHLISEICTDSSEVGKNSLFAAIRGKRTDGHCFFEAVKQNGCRAVLCEELPQQEEARNGMHFILVPDVTEAIGRFAAVQRKQLVGNAVGITGSVGKTTVKELTANILGTKYSVFRTPENKNSLLGMPLSFCSIASPVTWAVCELGMNAPGEILKLSQILQPKIGVITNVGSAHLGMLGSREAIAKAKWEIVQEIRKDGVLLCNGDEPLLESLWNNAPPVLRRIRFSMENPVADCYGFHIRTEKEKTVFDWCFFGKMFRDFEIKAVGKHMAEDALIACCAGTLAGVSEEQLRLGLSRYEPIGLRQKWETVGGVTMLEDCYNASPESVRAALDVIKMQTCRKIAVLGDLLELGTFSHEIHREIGSWVAEAQIDRLITVGNEAERIAESAASHGMKQENITVFPLPVHPRQIARYLGGMLRSADTVLFKAAHGMRLEQVVSALREELQERGKEQ